MARASAKLLLLSEKDVEELSALMGQVDSVELKLNVPHGERRSTLDAVDADLVDAELRHVYFFELKAGEATAAGPHLVAGAGPGRAT